MCRYITLAWLSRISFRDMVLPVFSVNTTSVDPLPFSIYYAVFADKMLVFRRYVIFHVERLFRSQLTAEVRIRDIRYELIGVVRIVFEAVVKVVVHDGCSRSERHLSVKVGEKVKSVVVVMLGYMKRGVHYHPVNEVGELTPVPHAGSPKLTLRSISSSPLFIAFFLGKSAREVPEREGFAGFYPSSVNFRSSQREVHGFVFLKLRLCVSERPSD